MGRYHPKTGSALYSDEEWRKLCEKHEGDPRVDKLLVSDATLITPQGAAPAPPEPLTTLIGVYALAGGDLKRLIEALGLDAPSADTLLELRKHVEGKKKRDKVDGLKTVAQQVARLVCGGQWLGRLRDYLTTVEQDVACYITSLREEGVSTGAIVEKLSNHRCADGSRLTEKDVLELGNLRLRYPQS